jgi:hypothetical protein
MHITHNNHLQFGWGDGTFNFDNKFGEFWVKFGGVTIATESFRQECVNAARLIGEAAKQPILIFFSGGIDSEVVVRSFQQANVPFEIAVIKYKYLDDDHVNEHETRRAYEMAIENDIKCHTITVDLEHAFKDPIPQLCKRYKTNSWLKLLVAESIRQFSNYHVVIGGGQLTLQRHKMNGRRGLTGLYLEEELVNVAAIEVAKEVGAGITNRFFMYTPELMLSWLTDPTIAHWVKCENALNSAYTNLNYYGIKTYTLYQHWPEMTIRPKYSGIERMIARLNRNLDENVEIRMFFENIKLYKRTEFIINHETLLEWLQDEQ